MTDGKQKKNREKKYSALDSMYRILCTWYSPFEGGAWGISLSVWREITMDHESENNVIVIYNKLFARSQSGLYRVMPHFSATTANKKIRFIFIPCFCLSVSSPLCFEWERESKQRKEKGKVNEENWQFKLCSSFWVEMKSIEWNWSEDKIWFYLSIWKPRIHIPSKVCWSIEPKPWFNQIHSFPSWDFWKNSSWFLVDPIGLCEQQTDTKSHARQWQY